MSDEYNSLIYNSKLDKTTRNLKEATHDPTKTTKVRQKNYKKKTLLSDRNRSRLEKRDKYNKYNT